MIAILRRLPAPWLLAIPPMAIIALAVIAVPLDLASQWLFAGMTIVAAWTFTRWKGRKGAIALGLLAVLVSTRYIVWRTTQTLSFGSVPEAMLGTGLYLAELYAWAILILGFIQTTWPLDRPVVEPKGEPATWPTVDIYVPTYNESLEIVRGTVFAAMDLDYPADRYKVHILDDGRRPEFRAFAREAGCGYIVRDNNLHAKAGNLNAAMKKTDGDLIAIFDCDHVPVRAFLQLTVGWFQRDPRLALIQTPHHMYSPDPVQRNLSQIKDMAGEGDLFYGAVQSGNDLWNAAFFCGSCAIIRRAALEETNGFAGETVTEDAHTALKLQRTGWNTAYIGVRLSAGLATERLVLHIGQRIRWARGMTQILRIDCPVLGRGLSWPQRLCYLNAMLHFQFPLPRIVFLTSPLAYLMFGQNIISASAALIFAYALPHLACSTALSSRTQGGDRPPFWGEIYETILAFHLAPVVVRTLLQPRKGRFNVTDKGSLLDRTYFDWGIVRPHLICIGVIVAGMAIGLAKRLFGQSYFDVPADTLILNLAWASFSLIVLIAAISVARECRQVRQEIRVPAKLSATVYLKSGHVVPAETIDISMAGAALALPEGLASPDRSVSHVVFDVGDATVAIPAETINATPHRTAVRFGELDMLERRFLTRAIMGRADAWHPAAPKPAIGGLQSIRDIARVDWLTAGRLLGLERDGRASPKAKTKAGALAQAAVFALALVGGAALIPSRAHAATASTATPRLTQRLTLKDLKVAQPIRLRGVEGEIGIPFGLRQDRVVTGATLTLRLAWSPAMLDETSQLVVMLNGEPVRTLGLTRADAAGLAVTIPIDPALFVAGDNRLNLKLVGHYQRDCEDPFHSSLWAVISNGRSWLDLTVQPLAFPPDLARLPAPLFDKGQNLPLQLPFVFAAPPKARELEAAASVASWFGALASYRGFSFAPVYAALPKGNAVVFLTAGARLPGLDLVPDGPSAAMVRNPADATGTLLVVMGRDTRELRLAAAALANGRGVFGGQRMRLGEARVPTWPRYGAPRWITTDRPVRLGEIMPAYALEGMGLPPGPLSARFRVAPDLFFWPRDGGRLDLAYRYPLADWLDRRASRLDVSINGAYLKTLPLAGDWWRELFGGVTASRDGHGTLVLPRYNLFGQNQLVFDYNLIIGDKRRCAGTLPANVRVAVSPDSAIDFTSAYHGILMPDLAPFAGAGYPFTVRPDLSETTVLVAPNPSPATVAAFLTLMGRMGDSTGVPASGVTVTSAVDPGALREQDVLVIGPSALAGAGLFDGAPVRFADGRLQVTQRTPLQFVESLFGGTGADRPGDAAPVVYAAQGFAGLVSFRSPYAADRTVVALLADDPRNLPGLVEGMADARLNATIQGDLSALSGDTMTSFAVGERYWAGDLPLWLKLAYWFSGRPLLMALGAVALALILAGPAYLYFQAQARRRLAALEDGK